MNGIEALLDLARDAGASELFLSPNLPPSVRTPTGFEPLAADAPSPQELAAFEASLTTERRPERHDAPLPAVCTLGPHRVRARFLRLADGMHVVLRPLDPNLPSLRALGLHPGPLADATAGLLLVTGPSGSGRTTTLHAIVRHLSETRSGEVVTLESPCEQIHPHARSLVIQRDVGVDVPSYVEGLRAAESGASVVAVDDCDDTAAHRAAANLATAGRLVVMTVSAPSPGSAIARICAGSDAAARTTLRRIARGLVGVVVQRLVPGVEGPIRIGAQLVPSLPLRGALERLASSSSPLQLRNHDLLRPLPSLDDALAARVDDGSCTAAVARNYAEDPSRFDAALDTA
ncbi:MAG: ATPase, T2SS/T4P/T4SS family [Myxococcota bacterium]